MPVCRCLALAATVLAVQCLLLASAQASATQTAELTTSVPARHVGFLLVEPHRMVPPAPLMISAEGSLPYGRMTSGTYFERPNAAGALAAYEAGGSRSSANRWQFDETPGDWRFHSGHWHDSGDGHHGHDDDGHEHQPPAVPIPAALWLFASGAALLVLAPRARRGRGMAATR